MTQLRALSLERTDGPHWASGLLLFATVLLYARPQGIQQSAILAVLAGLILLAIANDHLKTFVDGRVILGTAFVVGVFIASLSTFSIEGSLIATSTFVIPMAVAWIVACSLKPERFSILFDRALLVLVISSLATGLLLPHYGVTQVGETKGAWRGIFDHRNTLGYILILFSISTGARWAQRLSMGLGALGVRLLLIIGALALCASTTALLVSAAALAFAFLLRPRFERNEARPLRGLWFPALSVVALLPFAGDWASDFVSYAGKESSIEGRMAIWRAASEQIAAEPWHGYGRLDILQHDNPVALTLFGELGYFVRSLHNGYLALILEVGLPAAVLGFAFLAAAITTACRSASRGDNAAALFLFVSLTAISVTSFLETRAFLEIGWFVTCCAAFMCRARTDLRS